MTASFTPNDIKVSEQPNKFDQVLDDSISTIKSIIAVVSDCPHCLGKLQGAKIVSK